jgi:hypothetical protein
MPAILISWSAVITTFLGIGLLVQRLYGVTKVGAVHLVRAFWVGFATTLTIAQFWSLFWPVDTHVWFVILPLGVLGLTWSRRRLASFARKSFDRPSVSLWASGLLLLLAVRIGVSAAQEVPFVDTGSYHLPATLWAHAYPVVPGLSNLHCRLGFNSSFFPYAALFADGPWNQRPHHITMGVLFFMFMAISLVGATRAARRGEPNVADVYAALLFAPAAYLVMLGDRVSSLSPNAAMALLVLVASWQVIIILTSPKGLAYEDGYAGFCAGLFLMAALTIKITVAPFAITSLALVYLHRARSAHLTNTPLPFKHLTWTAVWFLVLTVPWIVRGVVTSGYPFYPLTFAGLEADWQVPKEQAILEAEWTRSFSRLTFDAPPQGYEWLGQWALGITDVLGVTVPLAASLILTLGLPLLRFLPRNDSLIKLEARSLRMIGPTLLGLAAWFHTAPDPRYATGYIWILPCLLGSYVLVRISHCAAHMARFLPFIAVASVLTVEAVWALRQSGPPVFAACIGIRSNNPIAWITCGLQPLPAPTLRTFVTSSGLALQVPTQGPKYADLVWNAPLLSTPHPSPNLKLRDPTDISKGFVSDGPWRPVEFPGQGSPFQRYVAEQLGYDLSR